MTLNENSITARLYRWFYNQKTMPESLCPYFWKLLLMWVFIIPYSVITVPPLPITKGFHTNTGLEKVIGSLLIWFAAFLIICMVAAIPLLIIDVKNLDNFFVSLGLLVWAALIIISGIALIFYTIGKIKDKQYNKEKQDSVVKEFIKAKYNKYCPKITWK